MVGYNAHGGNDQDAIKAAQKSVLATGRCKDCNCKNGWSECHRIGPIGTEAYNRIRWRENQT